MTTKLLLYNEALVHLGQRRLLSLNDRLDARRALDDVWDSTIAYCLEQGFWNFAIRSALIDASTSVTPSFGYTYAAAKPSDWIRTFEVSVTGRLDQPLLQFNDESGYWYCDYDPIYVRYISNDTAYGFDLSQWPKSYTNYVAHRLAV